MFNNLTTVEFCFMVYLGIGVVYASVMLYVLRNVQATFYRIVVDAFDDVCFWPYKLKRALAIWVSTRAQMKLMKQLEEEYKKDPEAYMKKLNNSLNDLVSEIEKYAKK